jgi:rare lipoprotein A
MRLKLLAGTAALAIPFLVAGPADAGVVKKKRLHVRVGRTIVVVGHGAPATTTSLQIKRRGHWRTIDRDGTSSSGRFTLRDRMRRPLSAPARVRVNGGTMRVGRVNAYRLASASWYGPGLYGNKLGCGGRLTPGRLGVAHKYLPCGAKVTLRKGARTVNVRVIDRGPYVGGREFDLTEATAHRLRFHAHGEILTTR